MQGFVPLQDEDHVRLKQLLSFRRPSSWTLCGYCRSYSPLLTRFSTLNPAFLASEIESFRGELNVEKTRRTAFLHAGHFVKGVAESGR